MSSLIVFDWFKPRGALPLRQLYFFGGGKGEGGGGAQPRKGFNAPWATDLPRRNKSSASLTYRMLYKMYVHIYVLQTVDIGTPYTWTLTMTTTTTTTPRFKSFLYPDYISTISLYWYS